mgnify:CR=1 FL=1
MEYKELVEQESQLKKSQVLYIKEVLAQNNGRVEMKYKPQEEFEDEKWQWNRLFLRSVPGHDCRSG